MKPRDLVLEQIAHHATRPVPYTLGFEGDVAERLDAHYGSPAWRERLTCYIASVPGAAILAHEPLGDGTARDGFGGIWRMDRRPWHLERPPLPGPTLEGYDFPGPERFATPELHQHALALCEQNRDAFLVASMGWGLFEASWGLRGFEGALMDAACEPDFYGELLDKLTDNYLAFVEGVRDLPVDGVMFGDDWGDQRGVILGPERWRAFMKPRYARIYEAVHAQGKRVLTHCCGSVAEIMDDLIEIGLDVLESCQPEAAGMDPYRLKRRFGERITLWGCLGSQSTIPFGTPQAIRGEIARLIAEMGAGGGFILAPAKSLQPETPTENAAAVVEAFADQG
jgi:uroporphyrinogen decarboxylase